jgi:hypothetical protein
MNADAASLIELGLLPDGAGHWPLSARLDHTHARPGSDALRRLLATPLGSAPAIAARQVLLRDLAPLVPLMPWRDLVPLLRAVEGYLDSNFVSAPATRQAMPAFALRHRDIVRFVAEQVPRVEQLLTMIESLLTRLSSLEGDASFAAVRDALSLAAHDARRGVLAEAMVDGSAWRLCQVDAMLRDGRALPDGSHGATIPYRDRLRALIAGLWQLDAFCALAVASQHIRQGGGCLPDIVAPSATLSFRALRHPLLPDGVTNDLPLSSGERVCFLTGPNMAGKSTLLRAIGVAVHFAHVGMAVPASHAQVPLYDRLLASITARDNLARGESLYLAEIRRVKVIVDAVARGDAVLAIFDEVFRGTNVVDATEATGLLVDGLARASHGTFVIASHLAAVGDARIDAPGVATWCLEVLADNGGAPRFTHRVRRGVSDVHLGMRLLDAEGVGGVLRGMIARG